MIFLTIANVQLLTDMLRSALAEGPSMFIVADVLFFVVVFCSLILEKS